MKNLIAILVLSTAGTAFAQGVAVKGIGTFSCGKYLQLRAERSEAQNSVFVSWVWGYMAAFNMESRTPTKPDLPDEPSTLAYVDKYCRENPLETVLGATNTLIRDLGGKRNSR